MRNEVEREVERRDRADHADRPAQRERELPLACLRPVHRHHLAGELARLDGGERVGRHRALGLDAGGLHRLAGLLGDQPCGFVVATAEPHRHAHEDLRALVGRQRLLHCCFGGVDRALRLVRAGLRDPPDDLAGVWRANLEPVAGLDPLAGDEDLPFQDGCGHAASLDSR